MSNKKAIIASAIASILALSTTTANADSNAPPEKCYGISKAGMNDCASGANTCSGSATKDNQGDAYIIVPNGLCSKITGGSLNPIDTNTKKP